jgi:N-acetylmuramoyl-L-alanine amidase
MTAENEVPMAEDYTIREGDCVSSVAYERGFFWETLWDHPSNSALKSTRKDPNILKAGDVLHVPDLTLKQESGATEKTHTFTLKGVPAKLRLRLTREKKDDDKPVNNTAAVDESSYEDPSFQPKTKEVEARASVPYIIEIDGVSWRGKTDGDGHLEEAIPPNAQSGRLILNPGAPEEEVLPLALGGMDPSDEITGARGRLCNLGFPCLAEGEEMTDDLDGALRQFQEKNGLQITGQIDDATKDKLKSMHGS